MNNNISRQPAGSPTGGQFAEGARGASGVNLGGSTQTATVDSIRDFIEDNDLSHGNDEEYTSGHSLCASVEGPSNCTTTVEVPLGATQEEFTAAAIERLAEFDHREEFDELVDSGRSYLTPSQAMEQAIQGRKELVTALKRRDPGDEDVENPDGIYDVLHAAGLGNSTVETTPSEDGYSVELEAPNGFTHHVFVPVGGTTREAHRFISASVGHIDPDEEFYRHHPRSDDTGMDPSTLFAAMKSDEEHFHQVATNLKAKRAPAPAPDMSPAGRIAAGAAALIALTLGPAALAAPSESDIATVQDQADAVTRQIADVEVDLARNSTIEDAAILRVQEAAEDYNTSQQGLADAEAEALAAQETYAASVQELEEARSVVAGIAMSAYRSGAGVNQLTMLLEADGITEALSSANTYSVLG